MILFTFHYNYTFLKLTNKIGINNVLKISIFIFILTIILF